MMRLMVAVAVLTGFAFVVSVAAVARLTTAEVD